ncbi:MAG: DUF805 domain-containing protein [Phenylobacterium sp.]|uniref:DUF805 domain-containing protein n=1 Tax=Phenylobacterium sp. TaxID=1871053 RepID=UPI003017B42E
MLEAVTAVLRKYADFNGRARRSEYWWFELAYFLSLILLGAIGKILTSPNFQNYVLGTLAAIIILGALVPMLAVEVRRLHDIDKSGWNILWFSIPIVGFIVRIIWLCRRGTVGDNRFGHDPLAQTTGEIGL